MSPTRARGTADGVTAPPTNGGSAGRTWVIIGAGRGPGRLWATAALARADRVGVGARGPEAVADLRERFPATDLPLPWNLDERQQAFDSVARVRERFGGVDEQVDGVGRTPVEPVEERT